MKPDDKSNELSPREKPDVVDMIQRMEDSMSLAGDFIERMEKADETLEAWWEGQQEDGLKHDTLSREASPFDGASDQRIRVAEEILNERVLVQKAAMIGGRSNFKPKESGDAANAALFATLMGHFTNGVMRTEIRDESEFLVNWKEGYGHAILGVSWHEERALEERQITDKDLLQMAVNAGLNAAGLPKQEDIEQLTGEGPQDAEMMQQAQQIEEASADDLRDLLLSSDRSRELLRQIRAFDPDITVAEARRVTRALQSGGDGIYYAPYVTESRPKWEALQPFVDIFYSHTVRDIQQAPLVWRVHYLEESLLKDKAIQEGWDEGLLKTVLKNPGRQMTFGLPTESWAASTVSVRCGLLDDQALINQRIYQIVEVYSRRTSIAGAPCIYRTILHGSLPKDYLKHEVQKAKHGRYPFVSFRRERKKKMLTSSRGIPELVMTNQKSIKGHHDSRADRVSIAISPPLVTTGNRGGGRITIGPNMEISEKRAGSLRWFEPPPMDMDSVAIVKDERSMLNFFFGRWNAEVPQPLVQLHQQTLVNDWLTDLSEAVLMTAQLVQQYVTTERASRIVGTNYSMDATTAAIQQQWDLEITFDVRDMDLDWLKKKTELMNSSVLAADTLGVVDRAAWVEFLFASIDPVMAKRIIIPREKAAQDQMEDEDRALTTIFTGGEPDLVQGGQDHAARAQRMVEKTQESPTRMQTLQTNGQIKEVWDNRLKFHQTQVAQEKNKQIGRMGGAPVLAEALGDAGRLNTAAA